VKRLLQFAVLAAFLLVYVLFFRSVSVQVQAQNGCGDTANWTSSACQAIAAGSLSSAYVNGTQTSNAWTVISRHGEYAQNENECNIPSAISVANSLLVITTSYSSYTCGDFSPTSGASCPATGCPSNGNVAPSSWPYTTGDVEWNTFSFQYGTIIFKATYPSTDTSTGTGTWPAHWMLATNCQSSNKYSGDTGAGGCPSYGQSGYDEIDLRECYLGTCGFHIYHNNSGQMCPLNEYPGVAHTWWMNWTSGNITLYEDGNAVSGCSFTSNIPAQAMFLIIQTQTAPSVEGPPNNSNLPTTMTTDYVKVCDTNLTASQCNSAAYNNSDVIFYDDFN